MAAQDVIRAWMMAAQSVIRLWMRSCDQFVCLARAAKYMLTHRGIRYRYLMAGRLAKKQAKVAAFVRVFF